MNIKMKKNIILIVLFWGIFPLLFAQKMLSKNKCQEDIKFIRDLIKTAYSGLPYRISLQEFETKMQEAEKNIKSMNEYDFLLYVRNLLAQNNLKNAISINVSEQIVKEVYFKNVIFPLPIKIINEEIFVNFDFSETPLCAKILTINKMPIENIFEKIAPQKTKAQRLATLNYGKIEDYFSEYCFFIFNQKSKFEITYTIPELNITKEYIANINIQNKGKKIIKQTLNALTPSNFQNRYNKNYWIGSKKYFENFVDFNFIDSLQTLHLAINSFAVDNKTMFEKLNDIAEQFEAQKGKTLIIDLRLNKGSNPDILPTLFAFFGEEDYSEQVIRILNQINVPYIEQLKKVNDTPKDKNIINQVEVFLKENFYKDKEIYKSIIELKNNPEIKPYKKFNGKTFVLISNNTSAAAVNFARFLATQKKLNVTFVGQETDSAKDEYANNIFLKYGLPNANLEITIPLIGTQFLNNSQGQGKGIIPQHQINLKYEDFFLGKDTELEQTLQLIQESK